MSFNFFSKASPAARPVIMSQGIAVTLKTTSTSSADYLNLIKTYPMLSESEERDLTARWYTHGDRKAYDALISSHLRLVPKIAQKYLGYGIDVTDLISEGNLGLLQSAVRFKPEKGFRFSTYARWWIKAEILNFVLQTWSLIKVGNGANNKRLFFNLRRAKRTLHTDGERYLSDKDIAQLADHFRVAKDDIVAMDRRMSANDVSLSQTIGHTNDGDAIQVGDTIADDKPSAEDILIESDERDRRAKALRSAIEKLDKREREIVSRRYLTEQPITLSRLATLYGLTAERVRQIEARAIAKIKHYLRPRIRKPALIAVLAMFVSLNEAYA